MLKYFGLKDMNTEGIYDFGGNEYKIKCESEKELKMAIDCLDYIQTCDRYDFEEIEKSVFPKDKENTIHFYFDSEKGCKRAINFLNIMNRIFSNYSIYMVACINKEDTLVDVYYDKYLEIISYCGENQEIDSKLDFYECIEDEAEGLKVFVSV